LAVSVQPIADFVETRGLFRHDLSVGARADVEKQVAVAAYGTDQKANDLV
jgi:hypothetical protein